VKTYPDKEEFCQLTETYSILPVCIEVSTDMETPVSLYYKLVGEAPGFILESAQTGKTLGVTHLSALSNWLLLRHITPTQKLL